MKLAAHQPHYLPWMGLIDKMQQVDVFVVLDSVEYERRGWQNRNKILTPQGPIWLTIPVKAPRGTFIKDVYPASPEWAQKHLTTILHNYAKSPRMDKYREGLELMYGYDHSESSLAQIAEFQMIFWRKWFEIRTHTVTLSDTGIDTTRNQRLIDLCKLFGADTYMTGEGGFNYMDLEMFYDADITVEVQEYTSAPYYQVWGKEKFVPGMSCVDFLLRGY